MSREKSHLAGMDGMPTPDATCAYFFDIDGTLLEIGAAPSVVLIDQRMLHLLAGLLRSAGGAVVLISGRSIADIDALFSGVRFPAAGQHGAERRDAAGRLTLHPFPVERLDAARRAFRGVASRHAGLLFEDKGLSLALHYRQAPRLAPYAHRLVRSWQQTLGDAFCVQRGKRVVELKPAGKDKGIAVREFMAEAPFVGRTPIFLGDDVTDEQGFDMVNSMNGYSIKVGPGPTVARFRLRDVDAVHAWLECRVRAVAPPGRAAS